MLRAIDDKRSDSVKQWIQQVMNIKKIDDKQLIKTKDVITRELKYEEALTNSNLKDFRLTFVIAKEAIEQELFDRKQLSLI